MSTRQRLIIAAAAAVVVVAGCGQGAPQPPVAAHTSTAAPTSPPLSGPQPIPPKAAVTPTRVVIPSIGVRQSTLEPLTRDPGTGELRPPVDFTKVGYYREGPVPGDPGPAVLAGHVDDTTGPKVFFRLRELKAGDQVTVTRSDGRDVLFHVDAVEQYPKDAFPTNAVYGPAPGSSLRLITCGAGSRQFSLTSYRP